MGFWEKIADGLGFELPISDYLRSEISPLASLCGTAEAAVATYAVSLAEV
jgi:hypothetical protein